jgi:glycosyltransferase involved in cell wall biosynthesis
MSASVLPNIPFPFGTGRFRFPRRDTGDGRTIVFVGSMAHGVNVSGVDAFVAECWPRIRAAVPDAVLRVYGTGLAEALRTRWESYEGVVVAGFVPDTRRVYGRAAFVVVPVFEGGGTKVKVLEALVHHRTCVAAEQALRGYEGVLRHGESVWVGSRHEDLVRGCVELLARPELRRRLAHKGCELVRRHYTFGRFAHVVGADVTRVLGAH